MKYLAAIIAVFIITACESPNHYDSHVGDNDSIGSGDPHHDTIQGRAPDSTTIVIDSTNTGIGDTTLNQTH